MIHSFGDKLTSGVWNGGGQSELGAPVARQALKRLLLIQAAEVVSDLRVPPGNRLEMLAGNLAGWHSIRINSQWRIVFRWTDHGAEEVKIVDYH